ncbi:MAG: YihA family ribosome biogenesis GTP-binding protein [Gemmatimonadota bacterium]|nr:MAG: YihA family ribosome biogenesis GTP-binding protein [Gemmatimonadota bacterium]
MCDRKPIPTIGNGAHAEEERGLNSVSFVGSFPSADFAVQPALPEIAFLGRSNVGKSSLLNRLINRRSLAQTSKTPGKTRWCNVYSASGRFYLVDLPGYGFARISKAERSGFSRLINDYLSSRENLAGVVWLLDIRREPSAEDLNVANLLATRGVPVLVAVTKADKVSRGRRPQRIKEILASTGVAEDQCVVTSARTREGTADLQESVLALVRQAGPGQRDS